MRTKMISLGCSMAFIFIFFSFAYAQTWETITAGPFRVGHFIGSLITFIIVALVIFILVKITKRIGIE